MLQAGPMKQLNLKQAATAAQPGQLIEQCTAVARSSQQQGRGNSANRHCQASSVSLHESLGKLELTYLISVITLHPTGRDASGDECRSSNRGFVSKHTNLWAVLAQQIILT